MKNIPFSIFGVTTNQYTHQKNSSPNASIT